MRIPTRYAFMYLIALICGLVIYHNWSAPTPRTVKAADKPVRWTESLIPIAPCRALDTRKIEGGQGPLRGGETRTIQLTGVCGVPDDAASIFANVSVIPAKTLGYLTVWPFEIRERPTVSLINSLDGTIRNNSIILSVKDGGRANLFATDQTEVVIDVSAYYIRNSVFISGDVCFTRVPAPYGAEIIQVVICQSLKAPEGAERK